MEQPPLRGPVKIRNRGSRAARVATHNFLRRVRGGLDTNQALPRREGLPDDRIQAFTHIRRDLAAGNDDGKERRHRGSKNYLVSL